MIQNKGNIIIHRAENNIHISAELLVNFAQEFAVNFRLKQEAISIASEINQRSNKDLANEKVVKYTNRIIELVSKIKEDNLHNPHKENIDKAKKTVRDFYISQNPDRDIVFEGKGISKTYTRGLETPFLLENIDIKIRLAQITGVIGENGNGKTTLLKIIGGIIAPNKGEIKYYNTNDDWISIKQQIAFIPQRLKRWNGTVLENLYFEAAIKGISPLEIKSEVEYILYRLGLTEFKNLKWDQLSGGYQMRFELAKTLLWKPKLLILDEPLANLDIKTQSLFLRDLRHLTNSINNAMSVVISSQHVYQIEGIADQIIFLKQGKPIYNGLVKDLGEDRNHNCFEISCDAQISEIQNILKDPMINQMNRDGNSMLIYTPINVTSQNILEILVQNNIKVLYFRDISKSTRVFFENVI